MGLTAFCLRVFTVLPFKKVTGQLKTCQSNNYEKSKSLPHIVWKMEIYLYKQGNSRNVQDYKIQGEVTQYQTKNYAFRATQKIPEVVKSISSCRET